MLDVAFRSVDHGGGPDPERLALRISYDDEIDFLWALLPTEVIDGQLEDEIEEPIEGVFVYRRGPNGPVIGFGVTEPFEWDVMANGNDVYGALWGGDLRFDVPTLGLSDASLGEIVLAAQSTLSGSTPDMLFFGLAVAAGSDGRLDEAEFFWRSCLQAGEMKAHFGLGYTLVELGRPREAFGHLRCYTEITPRNSWAWLWRGRAAEGMGEDKEAAASYRRSVEAEAAGSYETDAADRLALLDT
jgi:tetratricopeptide (TPR) repeat protein